MRPEGSCPRPSGPPDTLTSRRFPSGEKAIWFGRVSGSPGAGRGKEYTRAANLALEAFSSSEESRILNIYTLRLLIGDDNLLKKIVEDARLEAENNLKRYNYAYAEARAYEEEEYEQHHKEVVN